MGYYTKRTKDGLEFKLNDYQELILIVKKRIEWHVGFNI